MTHGKQLAKSDFTVDLNGEDCHTNVISRSVARENSKQVFLARINGTPSATATPSVTPSSWTTAWWPPSPR